MQGQTHVPSPQQSPPPDPNAGDTFREPENQVLYSFSADQAIVSVSAISLIVLAFSSKGQSFVSGYGSAIFINLSHFFTCRVKPMSPPLNSPHQQAQMQVTLSGSLKTRYYILFLLIMIFFMSQPFLKLYQHFSSHFIVFGQCLRSSHFLVLINVFSCRSSIFFPPLPQGRKPCTNIPPTSYTRPRSRRPSQALHLMTKSSTESTGMKMQMLFATWVMILARQLLPSILVMLELVLPLLMTPPPSFSYTRWSF